MWDNPAWKFVWNSYNKYKKYKNSKKVLTYLFSYDILTKSVARAANTKWDLSSAGRASALQAEGHRFEPCRSHSSEKLMELNMARWLNWLERPVHTREVESSSLSLATIQACGHGSQAFCYIIKT